MTLVLADKCNEKSIKEAIFAGRTIAYHNNKLIGKEEYLADLFRASVTLHYVGLNKKEEVVVMLTNRSSLPYTVKYGNKQVIADAMKTVQFALPKGSKSVDFTITNLICGNGKRPTVTMQVPRKE